MSKILAVFEILAIYGVIQIVGIVRHATGIVQWEIQTLGWSYTGMFFFVVIPALVIWCTRRHWADYAVSFTNWQINLDLGIKAYLVRIIPVSFLLLTIFWLKLDYRKLPGSLVVTLGEIIGLTVILFVLRRSRSIATSRNNLITTALLLLFPIVLAIVMRKLTLIILSTVVWQLVFSGFGEEFVWRGYVQSRLNQAFGRPMCLFGIQFGAGLIIASILFGVLHAFNTFDSTIGFKSLSWGWALSATGSGLFFGFIREKTGTLLAPGIAHGLPDAIGEALAKSFGWM